MVTEQTQGAPSSSLPPPSNLFQRPPSKTIISAILCHWDQPASFFELKSLLLLINHEFPDASELFPQGQAETTPRHME
ncbi:Wd Repeat-Containing Protein 19 [Manis pentadactyla]|nr:Wd Repeat-Containing Protein 19 [Manis pentadactyla]